ncbi:MAG: WYL domain-containing protein, partial [Eubacterium sp.]|nr:WYL domain-containing protein [Eubacterium sp.]
YMARHPGKTASYRIDRIDHIEVVEESVLSDEALQKIETVAEFTEQAFKMFSGELEEVALQFDKSLVGPVFDKFGEDTPMTMVDEKTCEATVHVQVSPTFFGWVAQFGSKMKIVRPEKVQKQFMTHLYLRDDTILRKQRLRRGLLSRLTCCLSVPFCLLYCRIRTFCR